MEWERRCLRRAVPEVRCRPLYRHPHSPAAKGSFWIWLLRFETKPANQSQLISLPMLVCLFVCMSLFLLLRHLFDVWFAWQVAHITLQPGLLLVVPAHRQALHKGPGPSAKPWEICSLTCPTEATFCMATGVHFSWGVLGSRLKDEGKGWMSRFWLRLKAHLNHFKRLTRKEGKLHCPCHAACWCRLPSLSFLQGSLKMF